MSALKVQVEQNQEVYPYTLDRRPLTSRRENDGHSFQIEYEGGPVLLSGRVRLPGVGGPFCFADNDGHGFTPGNKPVDFLREAVRTRIREIEELAKQLAGAGLPVPTETASALHAAREIVQTDSPAALVHTYRAGEALVEAETAWRIEGGAGKNDFLIGACMKGFTNGGDAFRDALNGAFNFATIPLTWGIVEPEQGKPRYDVIDEMVQSCLDRGIQMKGHALIWHSGWERASWQGQLDKKDFLRLSAARAREIMSRYANVFDVVELNNEPLQGQVGWFTSREELADTLTVAEICREYSPKTRLMINFVDEEELWFAKRGPYPADEESLVCIGRFIELLRQENVPLDLLGIQRHFPDSLFDSRRVIVDWQRRFGLPIHWTEFTIPSSEEDPPVRIDGRPMLTHKSCWRGQPWTEALQAEYIRSFFSLCYALPGVEAVSTWGMADAPALWADYLIGHVNEKYRLQWMANIGLLRADYSRKPGYEAVRELYRSWNLKKRI